MCFIASKGNLPQQGPCKRKFNVNAKLLFIFKQGQIHQMKLNKNDSKTELTESLILSKNRVTHIFILCSVQRAFISCTSPFQGSSSLSSVERQALQAWYR